MVDIIKIDSLDDELMVYNADLDISDEERLDFLEANDGFVACLYPDEIFNKEAIFMYTPGKISNYNH